jgi:hypothetical protein
MLLKTAYRIGYLRALLDAGIDVSKYAGTDDEGNQPKPMGDQSLPVEQLATKLQQLGEEDDSVTSMKPKVKQLENEDPKSYFQWAKGRSIASDTLTNLGIDFRGPMDSGVL